MRCNKPLKTKYTSIFELEMKDGSINFIARFSYLGTRYGDKNMSKLYGCKSAKSASTFLSKIKHELSEGRNPFSDTSSDKVEDLLIQYFSTKTESYRLKNMATYSKNVKSIIGHLKIGNVTKQHLLKIIKTMTDNGKSPGTIKKVKTILSPIFKEAYESEIIKRNIISPIIFGSDIPMPPLTDRIKESLLTAIQKIYKAALEVEDIDIRLFFLISIHSGRRLSEIVQIRFEDIIDGIVHIKAGTTKTYKYIHPDSTIERFPLPRDILDLIGNGEGRILKYQAPTYSRNYHKLVKNADLQLKPLAQEYPITSHSNRNFIMSIMSKEYGRDMVGSAFLSHNKNRKSDINARYDTIELIDVKRIHESYWDKLRGFIEP